jgi:hypothetical protein
VYSVIRGSTDMLSYLRDLEARAKVAAESASPMKPSAPSIPLFAMHIFSKSMLTARQLLVHDIAAMHLLQTSTSKHLKKMMTGGIREWTICS